MEQVQIESKFADKQGEIMVVELGGNIDQSNSDQVQKMFNNIIQSGCFKVVIDFGKLFYMSSAGWGVFIGEIKRFRDNGGDIKLANMNPDIYDVFQMLEFYHILEDFPTVKEAILAFLDDKSELNLAQNSLVQSIENIESDEEKSTKQEIIEFIPDKSILNTAPANAEKEIVEQKFEKTMDLRQLPLSQKIRYIISENPILGVWGIKKILLSDHFGNKKISIFRLMHILKQLDLNTKSKRYRYYRSC